MSGAATLVIRGGTVVDGSAENHSSRRGIVGDRIVEIGHVSARGDQEIDAATGWFRPFRRCPHAL